MNAVQSSAEGPVLAVDLGGTQIRAALVTPDLALHCRRAVETRDEEGVDAVLARIGEVAAEVRADARKERLPEPVAMGISSPGPLDPWRGVVLDPPNLRGWQDVRIVERLGASSDLPIYLERDTNVAIMAEWRHGVARDTRNSAYITVSTGIGGSAVIGGRPLVGRHGTAGELGHITVELDGPRCGCGGFGHVEAIASGTALARDGAASAAARPDSILAELARAADEVDAELVARAAKAGDEASQQMLDRAFVAIGALCASLVNVLDPEVIIIGGSIAEHQPRIFDVVRREIERRAFSLLQNEVRIEAPAFGGDVSLVGALPIVNERIGDPAYASGSHRPPQAASQQQGAHRP